MAELRKDEKLPVIALRGLVMFPGTTIHFDVGREKSLNALQEAMNAERELVTVCQRDENTEDPSENELYDVGCAVKVNQIMPLPDGTMRVLVDCLCRAKIVKLYFGTDMLSARVSRFPYEAQPASARALAAMRLTKENLAEIYSSSDSITAETQQALLAIEEPGVFADRFALNVMNSASNKQRILECLDANERAELVLSYSKYELEIAAARKELQRETQKRMDRSNREYFLREQQHVIADELGEGDDEIFEYEKKLKELPMSPEARERTEKELKRLKRAVPQSPEAAVMQNYIEYMLELPWGKFADEKTDIAKARKVLENDHYGLEEVKKRILEYLAVRSLKPDSKGPILCLVGAPGVGKTSIARSVARALKREFCQVSLGGVHDEAEIRGHRRTYVGAMPGRVISAIKQCGSMNPVFLFDEIDKMASDMRGDPASAMLEVLDPEQNSSYRDHYIEAPFDLSKVLFITTANTLEAIPKPLFDRMELIEVPSYTVYEKLQIAKRHLWKKQLTENAMPADGLKINDKALISVIESYTMEAGVRTLERTLGKIIRKAVVERMDTPENERKTVYVKPESLSHYLGAPKYLPIETGKAPEVGVINGLAWTSVGGVVMPVEVSILPGSGSLELTGSLGDVMKESARIALSYVRSRMEKFGVTEEFRKSHDIHVHVPEGATPKDGPSAGIALTSAIFSALTGMKARQDIAMTGEVSLRGKVLPIGGLREKLLAAYRMGIYTVLIPEKNQKDLEELPEDIRAKLTVIPVNDVQQVLETVLPEMEGASCR